MTTFNDFLTLEDSVTGAGLALTAQVPSDGAMTHGEHYLRSCRWRSRDQPRHVRHPVVDGDDRSEGALHQDNHEPEHRNHIEWLGLLGDNSSTMN